MESTFLTLGIFLIAVGFLLMAADLFVGSGLMFVLSLAAMLVGIGFLFKHDTLAGAVGAGVVLLGGPAVFSLLLRVSPLRGVAAPEEAGEAAALGPDLHPLKGRVGRTISAMRPGGAVEIDGQRVDGITEGMMLGPNVRVRCIEVRGGQVVVRPLGERDKGDLESLPWN